MSRTAFEPQVHKTPGVRFIVGSFQLKVGANPDILLGSGWTVGRNAAGKYTVTLDQTFHRCVSLVVTVGETGDNQDVGCHREEIDMTTTFSSFVIRVTAGAGTDTETEDQQVSFICVVADTSIVTQRSA